MKRIDTITFILIFFTLLTINVFASKVPGAITISDNGNGYDVAFNLPAYNTTTILESGSEYIRYNVNDFGTTYESGQPELPLLSFNLLIPYDENQPAIIINGIDAQQTLLLNKIYPKQTPWSKNLSLSDRPFTINNNYYSSTGNQDAPIVTVSEPFIIAGAKGVRVTIHPFRYNPEENNLEIINSVQFTISLNGNLPQNINVSSAFNELFDNVFVNYGGMNPASDSRYLIITAPEYENILTQFINHKVNMGYNVLVYSTSITGTSNTGIKNFIQQLYNDPSTKPEYVLLVGDENKIPAWVGSGDGNPTTDINYVQLEGNDYFPDALIGRFSVTSGDELQNVITKSIFMESYIGTFQRKNVFMASSDNWQITESTHNYVIDNYFDPNYYNNLKLYTHTNNATTEQLTDALNANKQFAIYSGHGTKYSWADGPVFEQDNVRALNNTWYPFVFSFACKTGAYQIEESFGETWLRSEHGASTFYGASVDSYWDEDDILEKSVFGAMFQDSLTIVSTIFEHGMFSLINYFGGINGTTLRYLEMYNLMGDPSMPVMKIIPPDSTPPTAIEDLSVVNPKSNSLTINWTAPFDSTLGGIAAYDIRYSLLPINTENDFINANQILFSGQSDSSGTLKSFTVDSLDFETTYYLAVKAMDVWGNTSGMSNMVSDVTLFAPQLSLYPDSLHLYVLPNSIYSDSVMIANVSDLISTLDYNIELANATFPVNMQIVPVNNSTVANNMVSKDNEDNIKGMSVKGGGGPDQFGYSWIDSNNPDGPEFLWEDISTDVRTEKVSNWQGSKDEGYTTAIPIGIDFKFYGELYSNIYISTNGFISFSPLVSAYFDNKAIPDIDDPNNSIFALWDDLDGRYQGDVYFLRDADKFVVQFSNWQRYSGSGSLSFQIVLKQNNKIYLYYKTLTGSLNYATVGIENGSGTNGLQMVYNADYLEDQLAVMISTNPEWLNLNRLSGTIYNGNSAEVILNVNTSEMELGDYTMDMVVTTNDPVNPQVTIPITLTVTDIVSGTDEPTALPKEFELYQNYPNPFNPSTTIKFALPVQTELVISVYNSLGEKVAEAFNGGLDEGFHEINFNASALASGVYFYRFESKKYISTKKMIVIK